VRLAAAKVHGEEAMKFRARLIVGSMTLLVFAHPSAAAAQPAGSLTSEARAGALIAVRSVTASGDVVTGVVVNRSSQEVRDVQLVVTRAWLWRDEQNPGPINPGGSYYFTVAGPIAPGATTPFRFPLPTVDAPADLGSFETTAAVTGFTEVEYPGR
jgi:hypothetical protein